MGDSPPLQAQMTLAESHPSSTSADAISTPQTPVVTVGHTKEPEPGTGKPSTSWADLVEQGKQLPMEGQDDGFILVSHERKRPSETAAEGQSKRGRVQSAATRPTAVPSANKPRVQRCTKTLQKQAEFRAKSAAGQVDQCVYLEFSPEFSQAQYFLALEAKLGKGCVYQMSKMEGHIIVALSSVKLAERLIEEGLDIESANLRAFPLRKKAERIALGNVLFFITDADLIAALRPYGRVTSIVQQMMELENSCWADTRREAFITLHDGVRLSQIPARLEIKAKGMISSVYVSYGIRCSLCHRQGHKRANCPQKTGMTEDKLLFPERTPVTRPIAWSKPLDSSSQASPAAAPTSAAEIPPPPTATAVAIPPPSDEDERTNVDSSPPYNTQELPLSQDKRNLAQKQMDALMKNAKASEAIASVQKETNVMSLDDVGDLCQGYSAVVAPATTTVGSGLACVFAAGVVVHRQQILWPGKMAVIDLTVRGISVTCVNAHVSHAPEERCRQLQIIAALAREEGAWILGDLNISEESAKDLASGSAESLAELLDQADLVDVATFFDAALEHTRVATIGSRVDARRLDRILLPSGFCDRVTQYQTVDYAYSDHRAVLIQVGDPAPTRLPCIGKLLRSDLFVDRMETFIDEISVDLANLSPPMLWEKWTRIKANLVAEIRSLAPAVAESGGGYIERASLFLRRRLEDDTARSDYPSLSDLGRSLRARRRSPSTFTDDDGNVISGGQLRRFLLERLSSRFAQAPSSEEAIADFLAEVTPLEFDEWDQLFLADISRDQIAAAIHRLPNGRASGWDGLPCEFVKAFEDFFAEVLWQVFEASRLRGALPPSSRRSKVILLPKVHGGPGLQAFRPISLPTTDYRVLSGVLMARLRRHLPDLVLQCQTYAVPGRSSSWNIARVSDEAAGASRHVTPLAVISLDLKSAFDTLSRSYLFALLEKLGLPSTFLGWIAVLYGEADASIRVGDVYTKAFPLLNGVRQGCRLSAALFSIGVGPLLRRLERTLGHGNVVAYADDIVLFIRDDAQFELVPLIFEEFRMSSGVAINFKKSCGLWCGSWKHRTDSPLGISWTSESLTVLGCTITTRNTVASQASHLMGLLERAIARWSPFTRGLSLVGRARAANSLVLGSILHHLHGYLPPETTVGRLQARLARFVWGTSRVSWLPGRILARPVSDGGVGLFDIAGQLRLACLKGVQASLRGAANGYSWLVRSRAWLTPPAPDVWHSPRRRRLLSLWEAASSVLELDHRILHPASLRSLRLRGDNRFLRPPDLLAPERWLQATVGDFSDGAPALARSTRAALLDAQHLGAFCQRLLRENASSSYHAEYEAETIVLRGSATPITRLPSQRARRALDSARLQAFPTAELAARWTPTVDVPRSIHWADLRRNCFSGHDADVALRLALRALPHPDHPASRRANCAACGSSDGSLAHRYWSCRAVRPLLREVFASCEVPLDLQAWLFGVGLHPEAVKLTSVAKATIYKYHLGLELDMPNSASPRSPGSAGQKPGRPSIPSPIGGKNSTKEESHKEISRDNSENQEYANPPTGVGNANLAVARGDVTSSLPPATSSDGAARALRNWADCPEDQGPGADDDFTVVRTKKRRRESANSPTAAASSSNIGSARTSRRPQSSAGSVPRAQEVRTTRAHITEARARQASSSEDHCIYLEHGPELQPFHYLRALDRMLGGTAGVIQVSKDSAIISALKPYGRVTSIAPKLMKAGPYTYNDGRREAFIVLREGMSIERLPTRLEIPIKGEAWPAYLSSGIKCSRCHGQGHRRANCPLLAGQANNSRLAPPTPPAGVPSTLTSAPPQRSAAQPPAPAPSSTAMEIPGASHAARAVTPSAAPRPSTPVASAVPMEMAPPAPPPVTPAPSLRAPGSHEPAAPTPDVEMSIIEKISTSSTSSTKTSTREGLVTFIERNPGISFAQTDALGLGREEVLEILSSKTKARKRGPLLSPSQCGALAGLIRQLLGHRPGGDSNIYKVLRQVLSELRTAPTAVPSTPPLPAPRPSGPTPPTSHGEELMPAVMTPPPPAPTEMEEDNPMTEKERCAPPPPAPRLAEPTPPTPHGEELTPAMATPPPPLSFLTQVELETKSPGPAGQEPGRPSILSPTGGKNSLKDELHREISRENSANKDHANPPTGVENANLAVARGDVTSGLPPATSSNGAARALRNWADCPEDQGPGADDDFTVVRTKKRRRESANSPTAAAPSSNIGGARTSRRPQSSAGSVPRAQEVRTTRAHITEARARQAHSSEDHCVYLEHGPELQPFHYLRALDRMLGGTAGVIQVSKVNGHQLLGLANRGLAERLINEGLEVEGTLLRAFPFRKRGERITVGNLPFIVEDSAIISALKSYGRVTSIAPKLMKAGPYTYNDGRREAFIVLREGMTIERLPTRLEIPIKGEAWPAYLSSGIKCSRCHGQGHRRANCPLLAGRANNSRLAPPTSPAGVPSTTTSAPPQRSAAQPPAPAPSSTAMEIPGASHATRAVTPSAAPRPSTPVASATKARKRGPLLSPSQCGALAGLIRQLLGQRPGGDSNIYKVLRQVLSELRTAPTAVPSTPPLPAPRPSGPTPPTSHSEELMPAVMTPPPPAPTEMEEDNPMTERCAPPPPAPRLAEPTPPTPHGEELTPTMATPPPPLPFLTQVELET
ncbi:hypothetical protein LAZ67_1007038, partial [Cordylochernes scorpioides]